MRLRRRADAARELARGDLAGGDLDAVERAQPEAHDEEGREAERGEHAGDHEPLDEQQPAERLFDFAQRHRHERDPGVLRIAAGEDAVAEARAAGRADGEHLADRHVRGQLRRRRFRFLRVVEFDVPDHLAARRRGAGRRCRAGGSRPKPWPPLAAVVRPARRRASPPGPLRVRRDEACAVELLGDRRARLAERLVDASLQERALLGVGDGGERQQPGGASTSTLASSRARSEDIRPAVPAARSRRRARC